MLEVLVVGAGPVGLALACELVRHGIRPRIIEAHLAPLPFCRAIGVTSRTLEVYEDMGVARQMIDAGLWLTATRLAVTGQPVRDLATDLSDLPYAALGVPQGETERVLAEHLSRFGITVERGVRLTSLTQEGGIVRADLEGPGGAEVAHTRYVVGCDGAHSSVRHLLDIPFEGEAWPYPFMLGDVRLDWPEGEELPRGVALRAIRPLEDQAPDMFIAIPLPEHGRYRVSMLESETPVAPGEGVAHGIQSEQAGPSLADIQQVADRVLARPPVVSDLRWSSRFRISMRLAVRYREGQVFIAGDACHIHPPTGGQGMNTGIQDAYNLAWKLALVLKGRAAPTLLDSYEAERQPVAEGVIAQTIKESMAIDRPKAPDRLAHTQMRVSYRGTPAVAPVTGDATLQPGDRMPDLAGLKRRGVGFPLRLFDLLKGPEHVLLAPVGMAEDLAPLEAEAAALGDRLPFRLIALAPADSALPDPFGVTLVEDTESAYRTMAGCAAILVRPDGYIAWRGAPSDAAGRATFLESVLGRIG
ncbi:FAD-dependent monooxygenase [Aquabacter cavernae]|uniref:FAD-dependent monooxygenase n=1 Tax=Aquabacter cavernae TaxID=2496029 RepID=UPI000F8F16E8|nr:FAD-dependent monooxygenase [Aquabacter cavernae]